MNDNDEYPIRDQDRDETSQASGDEQLAAPEDQCLELDPPNVSDTPGPAGEPTQWFAAARDGAQHGPLPLSAIQKLVRSGILSATDLVWHEGMSGWVMVQQSNELTSLLSRGSSLESPPPLPETFTAWSTNLEWFYVQLNKLLRRPSFFRLFARVSAILGLILLAWSLLFWFWGWTWFGGVLVLAVLFLIGEAAGATLELLERNLPCKSNNEESATLPGRDE